VRPDLTERLRAEIARSPLARGRESHVGVEHEFQVIDGGEQVDFRSVIHGLGLGTRHLDPLDADAYRLRNGSVLTCDGLEAEIAIPPEPMRAGFPDRAVQRVDIAACHLRELLPDAWELRGHSTHISVSVPTDLVDRVARDVVATVTPALLLLTSARDTPGLMVRPRPHRVELGLGFVPAAWLPAAVTFAAGCVLHLTRQAASTAQAISRLQLDVVAADHRYGWYVDRRAAGHDVNELGRRTPVEQAGGARVSAQDVLATTWTAVRPDLEGVAGAHALAAVDDVVDGRRPIRLESPSWEPPGTPDHALPPSPFGSMLATRERDGFDVAPVMAAWDVSVFVVASRARRRRLFACVPRDDLASFLERLDAGALDRLLRAALRRGCGDTRLDSVAKASRVGLFASLGTRGALLAPQVAPRYTPTAP